MAQSTAQVAHRLLDMSCRWLQQERLRAWMWRVSEGEASRMTPGLSLSGWKEGVPLTVMGRLCGSCFMKHFSCPLALLMTWLLSVVDVETLGGYLEVGSGSLSRIEVKPGPETKCALKF